MNPGNEIAPPSSLARENAPPSTQHILLVDDDSSIRHSLTRFLRRYGFQVTAAKDGPAALEAIRANRFDAVVSDLRMPGMSGEQLYAAVSAEFPTLGHRIVFTSGDLSQEQTQRFLRAEHCPALQKPYEVSELVRILRGLCGEPTAA